jgi:hypothetical protein
MANSIVHGFAWYVCPDVFGLDSGDTADPGHPFATDHGQLAAPVEVVYFRPVNPADSGVCNEPRAHSYLVMTKTQLHPKLSRVWDSEPAVLTEKFKTDDGKVKMVRIVQQHHRHSGNLLECELRVENA